MDRVQQGSVVLLLGLLSALSASGAFSDLPLFPVIAAAGFDVILLLFKVIAVIGGGILFVSENETFRTLLRRYTSIKGVLDTIGEVMRVAALRECVQICWSSLMSVAFPRKQKFGTCHLSRAVARTQRTRWELTS